MPVYTGKNPLESLGGASAYQFQSLTYPREYDDISSFGHYMNFYINVNKSSKYLSGSSYSTAGYSLSDTGNQNQQNYYAQTYTSAYPGATSVGFPSGAYTTTDATTLGGNSGSPLPGYMDILMGGNAGQLTSVPYSRITQAISMYIPDSMNFASTYDWQEASLTEAGGKALKFGQLARGGYNAAVGDLNAGTKEAIKHLGGGAVADILFGAGGGGPAGLGDIGLGVAGLAVNPQIFVLFRGVDMRTFQFDFIFTPKSPEEAANVRQIIKAFRFHAAPEIDPFTGRYFIAPSTFNIEYMYCPGGTGTGKRNQNIFQMMTLVLQKINVDYAPFGWSTYNDGMPVRTHLSMVFKETEILTKAKVNMGY